MAYHNGSTPGVGNHVNVHDDILGHFAVYRNLLQFLNGAGIVDYSSATATTSGDGTINFIDTMVPDLGFGLNVAETWTITFTSSTAFGVSGSVSGAKTAGVVGTNYTSDLDEICFVVNQGTSGNEWANLDTITFDVDLNPNTATNDKYEKVSTGTNETVFIWNHEVNLKSIGLAGVDEIFHSMIVGRSGAPLDRWWVTSRTQTGYDGGLDMDSQPGVMEKVFTPVWDGGMNYWFVCNGRRFVAVFQVSGTMHAIYGGFIETFATASEYPYPYFVGGESDTVGRHWGGDNGSQQRHFVDSNNGAYMRAPDGAIAWFDSDNASEITRPRQVHPWIRGTLAEDMIDNLEVWNGDYVVLPTTVVNRVNTDNAITGLNTENYGVLDGVYAVNGLGLGATNIISIAGQDYLVVNQVEETNRADYWLLKLE